MKRIALIFALLCLLASPAFARGHSGHRSSHSHRSGGHHSNRHSGGHTRKAHKAHKAPRVHRTRRVK